MKVSALQVTGRMTYRVAAVALVTAALLVVPPGNVAPRAANAPKADVPYWRKYERRRKNKS